MVNRNRKRRRTVLPTLDDCWSPDPSYTQIVTGTLPLESSTILRSADVRRELETERAPARSRPAVTPVPADDAPADDELLERLMCRHYHAGELVEAFELARALLARAPSHVVAAEIMRRCSA
jgi:hypothetical protein